MEVLSQAQVQELADFFHILSNPTRILILKSLMLGNKNVTEIVEFTGCKQSNISKQLKILLDGEIISRIPKYPEIYYEIKNSLVIEICKLVCSK